MKVLLSAFLTVLGVTALADGLTTVSVNGNSYSNISKAYLINGGKIIIIYPSGGTSANADKVPDDCLKSWGINVEGAKAAVAATSENNLERGINAGYFREVDGVVYNTQKSESGWTRFSRAKVIQITDEGAIVDSTPDSYSYTAIFVKNMSSAVGDTDFISFIGKPTGNYSYVNKKGDDRTIREYDLGKVFSRSEIPESVLSGKKAYDLAVIDGAPQTDVVAMLPDSDNLTASGSGFFITEDGYLVTNNHVVKNARRVKVKTGTNIFSAEIIRVDATNDLALLKVNGHFMPLRISKNDVQLGDQVFTIGFPDIDLQGTQPKYTDGKISSLSGIRDDPNEYQISVPVQPGNSGGPLVDMAGNVRGVVVARLNDFAALRSMGGLPQNVNYAVKGKLLRDFLAQSDYLKLPSADSVTTGNASVAEVQQSVAIVLIY
jgi:S1-C subfamily serine protease